jgi:hypothetical protein
MDQQTSEKDGEGVDAAAEGTDVAAESTGGVAATALSRRALLAGAGTLATLGTAVGLSPRAALAATAAGYSASPQVIEVEIDGASAGAIQGVAGGTLSLLPTQGPSARVQVEPVRLAIGTTLSPKLHDWLLAPNAPPIPLNLAAQAIDRPERRQLVLANARVIEFAVGPFDATVGEPLELEALVEATGVRHVFTAAGSDAAPLRKRARAVPRSSFRLLVQGFEKALVNVRKVDRIVVREPSDAPAGAGKRLPGQVEFELPVMDVAPLARWAEDVASGRAVKAVPGVLQVFDATGKTLVATIDLFDLTIAKFTAPLGDVSGSSLQYATVVLQPREIRFNLKGLIG